MSQIVEVHLSNRWARFTNWYPDSLSKYLSYRKSGYYFAPAYRAGVWDGRTKLISYRRIQSGLFTATRKDIEPKLDIQFQVTKHRKVPEFVPIQESNRPYQNECREAMIKASNCGGIILAATGTGKTKIAGDYFKSFLGWGVFIVDELTLLQQTKEELEKTLKEKVGEIGNRKFLPERISVATIQTIHRHRKDPVFKKWRSRLQVIIFDELHLALSKRNLSSVSDIPALAVFGLTATLELTKADVRFRAYALCGPVLYKYPISLGVTEKVLIPGVCVGVNISKVSDDLFWNYQEKYIHTIVKSKAWNHSIRRLVVEGVHRKHAVIVVVDRVAHVKKLTKQLTDLGIAVDSVYGLKTVKERRLSKALFELGELDVLVVNKVFSKGIDLKRVSVIIDGTSGKSKNSAIQRFGRGVRLHKDKTGLLHFDIGYNSGIFRKAAKSRRRALRAAGIRVKEYPWTNAKTLYNQAERQLKIVLRELKVKETKK